MGESVIIWENVTANKYKSFKNETNCFSVMICIHIWTFAYTKSIAEKGVAIFLQLYLKNKLKKNGRLDRENSFDDRHFIAYCIAF